MGLLNLGSTRVTPRRMGRLRRDRLITAIRVSARASKLVWFRAAKGGADVRRVVLVLGFADWTSTIVACGGASAGSGLDTWDAKAGSTITTEWNTWPESHQGSITDWAAACPASGCDGVEAAGLGWFKIHEENWNGASWPTVDLITKNNLKHSFKIPSTLPDGDYLIRHELLAMHTVGMPQVYPVCAQFAITGGSGSLPSDTVTFPASYDINPGALAERGCGAMWARS